MIKMMKGKPILLITSILFALNVFSQTDNDIYQYTKNRVERLQWWKDAKFGMFIHWGLYSIPAGQWNNQRIKGAGEWLMYHAKVSVNDYKKLADEFNPTEFDAEEWAKLARDAGMKYIIITAKHVDGFAMYHSKVNEYNVVDATPFNRDPIKELKAACEKFGLKLGFYYSHNWDWSSPDALGLQNTWDYPNPENKDPEKYYKSKSYPQIKELVENYHPDIMWFDVPTDITRQQSFHILKMIREINPKCIINDRISTEHKDHVLLMGDYYTPEQYIPSNIEIDFETCMTMNDTWGYQYYDNEWKSTTLILENLIRHANMGGNYLLNIGPDREGNIPPVSQITLKEIGKWLKINGESIYGTNKCRLTPFTTNNYILTTKPNHIYVQLIKWPPSRQIIVPEINATIENIEFLNNKHPFPLNYTHKDNGDVYITIEPMDIPMGNIDPHVNTLHIKYSGELKKQELSPIVDISLTASFYPGNATIQGNLEWGFNKRWGENRGNEVQLWSKGGSFTWDYRTIREGHYSIEIVYGAHELSPDNDILVEINNKTFKHKILKAEGWYKNHHVVLGELQLDKNIKDKVKVSCSYSNNQLIANFMEIRLVPLTY